MTTALITDEAPREKRNPVVGPIALASFISIAPLGLLFIPSIQEALAHVLDFGFSAEGISYDPAGPAALPESTAFIDTSALIGTGMTIAFAALATVILWVLLSLGFLARLDKDLVSIVGLFVGIAAGAVALTALAVGVSPRTEGTAATNAQPSQVAKWVEGRYGLDINPHTAEALLDSERPVLIENRLLNLTHIAQGGYVLTEDGTATELPTTE